MKPVESLIYEISPLRDNLFQGTAFVVYSMDVNLDVHFLDIEECAADVAEYVIDGNNWPDPILPGSTDCIAMELNPPRFDAGSSQWICPQTDVSQIGWCFIVSFQFLCNISRLKCTCILYLMPFHQVAIKQLLNF